MPSRNLVLRTIYIDPDVDDTLRTEAFDSRTSKNDLLRKYLRLGMEAARAEAALTAGATNAPSKRQTTGVVSKSARGKGVLASGQVPAAAAKTIATTPVRRKPATKVTAEG